jgi:hypothetical protein
MPLPTIAFGILLSTLFGAFYHLLRGGPTRKMAFFLLLSWAGFWLGDTLGSYMGWWFMPVGLLNAGMATIFSFMFLLIGDFLSRIVTTAKQKE